MSVNPKRAWRDIQETADPRVRRSKLEHVGEIVRSELARLREEEGERERDRESLAYHPGNGAGTSLQLRTLTTLAAVLVLLDVPVQYVLTRAALPQVGALALAIAAPGIALGVAVLVHMALFAMLAHDRERPARSIRLCRTLAAVGFLMIAGGAAVFLFARQATPEMAGHIVGLASVSLWAVAEAMPVTAGAVSAWAHLLSQPVWERKRLQRLRTEIDTLERLLDRLGSEQDAAGPASAGAQPGPHRRPGSAAAAIALMLALIGTASPSPAQEAVPNAACAVFVDRTLSLDPVHRTRAVELLSARLPEFVRTFDCGELVVGTFGDEGRFAPRQSLRVPREFLAESCDSAAIPLPPGTTRVLAQLNGFRTHLREKALQVCLTRRDSVRLASDRERRNFLRSARAVIGEPQHTRESRTDIGGVVRSLIESGIDVVVLLTDGIDSTQDAPPARILEDMQVLVLQVPAAAAYGGITATDSAAARWRAAGARVLPYTAFETDAVCRRFVHCPRRCGLAPWLLDNTGRPSTEARSQENHRVATGPP